MPPLGRQASGPEYILDRAGCLRQRRTALAVKANDPAGDRIIPVPRGGATISSWPLLVLVAVNSSRHAAMLREDAALYGMIMTATSRKRIDS